MSSNSNITIADPFAATKALVLSKFWPEPSKGFDARILAQLGLCAYLFVSTCVFLVLYYCALRKQGKTLWAWRTVETRHGRYITPNMYIVSVVPSLIASGLIAGLLVDTRQIFILKGSQHNSMLWRTVIWIVVYLQGWFAAFSGVTAALLITTESKSFFLRPAFVNSWYIGGLVIVLIGLIVPGVLCSQSWNYISSRIQLIVIALDEASAQFKNAGVLDADAIAKATNLQKEALARSDTFYNQYLAMLIIWTVASIFLVLISLVGWSLVIYLRRQCRRRDVNISAPRFPTPARASAMQHHHAHKGSDSTWLSVSDAIKVDSANLAYTKSGGVAFEMTAPLDKSAIAGLGNTPQLCYYPPTSSSRRGSEATSQASSPRGDEAGQRAMSKLVRDLIVTSFGVTTLASIFVADTLLLAIKRHGMFEKWQTAEVGLTLTTWSYLLILCICTTAIVINEIFFLRGLESNRIATNNARDGGQGVGKTTTATSARNSSFATHSNAESGIRVERSQHVHIDSFSASEMIEDRELGEQQGQQDQSQDEANIGIALTTPLPRSQYHDYSPHPSHLVPDLEPSESIDRRKSYRKPVPRISDLPKFQIGSYDSGV